MTQNTYRLVGSALALLLAGSVPACVTSPEDDVAVDDQAIQSVTASDLATSKLGVTTWDIIKEGADTRVIGRGADTSRATELVIRRTEDADRVELRAEFPEHASVVLTRTGAIEGTRSAYIDQLAAAFFADLGTSSRPLVSDAGGPIASAGTIASGSFALGWSVFGYSFTTPVGPPICPGGAQRQTGTPLVYTAWGTNICKHTMWVNGTTTNCQMWLQINTPGGGDNRCFWFIDAR